MSGTVKQWGYDKDGNGQIFELKPGEKIPASHSYSPKDKGTRLKGDIFADEESRDPDGKPATGGTPPRQQQKGFRA